MKELLKKNKALFILPLGLLPFVVLIFYILGGGKPAGSDEQNKLITQNTSGVNYNIPEAERSIEIYDKLEAYQRENIGGKDDLPRSIDSTRISKVDSVNSGDELLPLLTRQNKQLSEQLLAHIKQKEKQIQAELSEGDSKNPEQKEKSKKPHQKYQPKTQEKVKPTASQAVQGTDIDELDKVFDENITLSRQNDSLKFYLKQAKTQLQLLNGKKDRGFVLEKQGKSAFEKEGDKSQLIKAEIYETTTVLDGNRIKLRLLEDTWVNGKRVKQNTFIYGICKIKNERLHISITQIPTIENFIPVKLSIYDLDGLKGLYVPDNAARKVYREVGASTNTSSLMGVTGDPLAYAGIRAADRTAQTLLKRVRLKKVTVKKNTLVYLINQKH